MAFLLVVAFGLHLAHPCGAETATAAGKNFLPDAGFDRFEGDLPQGWTATIWNQPVIQEKIHRLKPGRDGTGSCLELERTTPMTVASLTGPLVDIAPDTAYLLKGYYSSTCQLVTTDKKWMGAEGVTITGHWIDAAGESSDSFLLVLPDTQDRWVPFFREVRAPQDGQQLRLVIERRWVGGRLRFDDFSLRRGTLRDFQAEFSVPSVADDVFFLFSAG